jgi:uncharacterized protein (DUF1810 family)
VDAQAAIYRQVVEELSRGRKQRHSMWFIFPQMAGLGVSAMAQRFVIGSRAEAAGTARGSLGRMHAPRHGRKRKAGN